LSHLFPFDRKEVTMKQIMTRLLVIAALLFAVPVSLTETLSAQADPATVVLDSASYTFVYPEMPDPAVWTMQTYTWEYPVVQTPIEGAGLSLVDPDNVASLMYVYNTPFLSGDPDNPNFQNTAKFRVRVRVPYHSDGSSMWSAEAIGWRMILDDGSHRLELALSRSATYARQVRIQNSSADPFPFPWDNRFYNVFEISRLANGDFQIALTNVDPSGPPVHIRTIPASQVPPSGGTPQFSWGMDGDGGGTAYWLEAYAEVRGPASQTPTPDTTPPTITAPAAITANATSPAGAPVSFAVTATDDRDPNPVVSCSPASGSTFPIGTTSVTCTATDAATNTSSQTFPVTVRGATDQLSDLIALVQSFNLQFGIANSLDAKLQNAQDALEAARVGSLASACNKLSAFANEVQAQAGNGTLTSDQATALLSATSQIKDVLGCA
jgi:hypothetical protein